MGFTPTGDLARRLPDAVVVSDASGTLVWGNEAAARLFGVEPETAVGQSALGFEDPAIGAIVLSLRDITDRRRWEVARDEVSRFRALVHNAATIIALVDAEGRVQSASAALTRHLGHDLERVEGHPLRAGGHGTGAAGGAGRRRAVAGDGHQPGDQRLRGDGRGGGTVGIGARRRDGQAEIFVEDEGDGVDPESALHAFEPFFSTKAQGTGLGLAIVARLAEAHGGSVALANRPEGGAVASVLLPLEGPST